MSPKANTNPVIPPDAEMALYYYPACPYCVMVLQVMEQMGLTVTLCNIMADAARREELALEGGRSTVPCLRIEEADGMVEWMYESYDIIDYLQDLQDE